MKISVLGIGTELTTGQILNRNAQWISQRLMDLGVPSQLHLVVPDEESLILEALEFCAHHSDHIFVTGGLGPTSDDFTRDVISRWTGRKLIWDESSWKHIEDRLTPRGLTVKEIQKKQCYYPEGSRVLKNRLGTANAFQLQHQGLEVYVLPGPPGEIEGVWVDHLLAQFKEKTKSLDATITKSWDTIGWAESDIADRVEAVLECCSFEKAYRVHMPYVEFKLSYPKTRESQAEKWVSAVEKVIGPMTVIRNREDVAVKLTTELERFQNIFLCDEIPGSFLMNRMFPSSKKLLRDQKLHFSSRPWDKAPETSDLHLHLQEDGPGSARATFRFWGQQRSQTFQSPYKSLLLKEREQQYFAEMAMIFWLKEILNEA